MAKSLVIVESPAKARTIGKFLGSKFVVKASMGHVRDLPKSGLGVDVENDFSTEWEPIKDRAKVLKELGEKVKGAESIFLATDSDREGEAIAWHLAEALLPADHGDLDVRRVVFHEITEPAIREAFEHAGTLNTDRVDAYRTRRILDRLMGYQLSPLLWKKMARGLSAGRVQSVAVRLVVEREREIREFIPEESWRLLASFGADAEAFDAELVRVDGAKPNPRTADDAAAILKRIAPDATLGETVKRSDEDGATLHFPPLSDVGPFIVSKLEQKARKDRPRPPFITSTLQQSASSRYGFAARRTMRVAQQLYEGMEIPGEGATGLITYMRTDSVVISKVAADAAAKLITSLYGPKYLPNKPHVFSSKKGAQEAHEAIRPTDPKRTPESLAGILSEEQRKLYELIWRRFMASQMASSESLVTTVELERNGAVFGASGRVITFDGHMRAYGTSARDDQLPPLSEGQQFQADPLEAIQQFSKPPRRYSEASLVRALEKHGIGRPSTYASIMSTIVDRKYVDFGEEAGEDEARRAYVANGRTDPVEPVAPDDSDAIEDEDDEVPQGIGGPQRRKGRAFHATHLGEAVTELLLPYFEDIVNTEFTADMESQLDRIAEGDVGWKKVVEDFYGRFASKLGKAETDMSPYWEHPVLLTDMTCGKEDESGKACEAPMAILFNRFGSYLGCSRYPDCSNTLSLTGRKKAEAELTEHTCRARNEKGEVCGRQMERKVNRWGKAFLACTGFKSKDCAGSVSLSTKNEPLWPVETSVPCPDCGTDLVVKRSRRGKFLACRRFPKCRGTLSIPACTHESRTGKQCGKPLTEPVAGGKMSCKLHPDVKLAPPKKAKKGEGEEGEGEEGDAKPAKKKATRKKATRKKAARKKATTKKSTKS
ncbi:MAG: DNA topoisomerase 1 [Planctomycetota bacterium]|nr:MAG: DNA topoisomerase 1 [Planctomycetota bacterium]